MAFTDIEIAEHTALIEKLFWSKRRPPLHLRGQVQEGQRLSGHAIEFFFVRPFYNRPGQFREDAIAKLRFVRSRNLWQIYWMRADLKWHRYVPDENVVTLADALRVIDRDANGCFFG